MTRTPALQAPRLLTKAAPAIALFTMEEAAEQLRVSRRWLQDFIQEHPYYRCAGRKKLFSADDIRKLHKAMPCPSNYNLPVLEKALTSMSEVESVGNLLTRLRKRQTKRLLSDLRSSLS